MGPVINCGGGGGGAGGGPQTRKGGGGNSPIKRRNLGVGVADVVKALVHHVGIANVWVRVQAAGTRKGHWEDPCTECLNQ